VSFYLLSRRPFFDRLSSLQDSVEALTPMIEGRSLQSERRSRRGFCFTYRILSLGKAPLISPSAEKMGLTLPGPEPKIANDLRLTVVREDTPQPANDGRGCSIQSTFTLPPKSLGSPSKRRCFERRSERDFCTQYLGKNSRACQNSPIIVDHFLPPLIPLSHLTQHDEESFPSTVLDHDSNLNNTRCRISYTGPTVTKVSSLHCPSKNGTSRPLRPPCLFPGSRFEHHLITLFEKGPQSPLRHHRSYSYIKMSSQIKSNRRKANNPQTVKLLCLLGYAWQESCHGWLDILPQSRC
jgi:hypothetical protein